MSHYLGLDIGATNLRCALATAEGGRVGQVAHPTPQGPTVEAFTDGVETAVAAVFKETGVDPAQIAAAGIASLGPLDVDRGVITEPANLACDLRNIPVRTAVASCLPDVPVRLCNDAIAGIVAEYDHSNSTENLAYVTFSSGIGAGVAVDGHILRGRAGNAAEVGHVTLDPDSARRCGCGGRGHWEAFAGGENVPAYAAELAETEGFDDGLLTDRCTAATVFDACGDDPLATETVDRIGDWNAQGMATLVQMFAPQRVAVGGAVALNNERLVLDPIQERIDQYLMNDPPEIALTRFGEDIVLRGALLLAAAEGRPGLSPVSADSKRTDL
ncbi:MAG: transcriptional regulator/sugar kinase [halophilic archaeon J07HX64]|jgi:Transcriptional regulator/sugar kinase|nr:MAG: transcriptional regulator/sugar kinase [halophilic archaeon J07HX64]